jgi:hypothetical protein
MANRTYTTGRGADRRQSHQAPRTATDGGKKLHV